MDAVSLAAACGAAGDACAGGLGCQPGGRTVPGLVRGGVWGSGGALPPVGVTAGPGGLGSWLVCRREHGFGACAWARLWCGGLRCIGASAGGGGPIEAGKRALPGCLIVLCSLGTDWMMGGGVFPLLCGLVGRPGLPWAPGLDGPGPPALGRFGVTVVPMGVSGGAGSRGGGNFCPL